ncbi:MAG: hypothetical protein HZA81_03155 [Candidatus Taylorbacteria bacterium]|nr:hypothetical protein [Candidatus Taylorbacteria bacterium]
MRSLTKDTPKPLLAYEGKSLIEHKLLALPRTVTKVVIVVGYLGDSISSRFGSSYKGIPIEYVEQKELLGTAHALWQAKGLLDDRFLVLMGDDVYGARDLDALAQYDCALLSYKGDPKRSGGKFILNEDGSLRAIVEDKDGSIDSPLVYTGACVVTPALFDYPLAQIPGRKEFGLPQTIVQMADKRRIHIVEAEFWKQITSPEDLA